mmetsp:Transcript_63263/g.175405  ORF Transcript_63263/g.175405 Transcript_63263/m.175405 type:complete len:250 (+) Transcript_63263:191-940(+)
MLSSSNIRATATCLFSPFFNDLGGSGLRSSFALLPLLGVAHNEHWAQALRWLPAELLDRALCLRKGGHLHKRVRLRLPCLLQESEPHDRAALREGRTELLFGDGEGQRSHIEVGAGLLLFTSVAYSHRRQGRGQHVAVQGAHCRLGLLHTGHLHQGNAIHGFDTPRLQHLQPDYSAVLCEDRTQQEVGRAQRQAFDIQVGARRGFAFLVRLGLGKAHEHRGPEALGHTAMHPLDGGGGLLDAGHLDQSG